MDKFKLKVIKHLKEHGFNCMVHPKTVFPEIVAWKPFEDAHQRHLALNVEATIDGKQFMKVLYPFFVTFVECREKKKFTKKDKSTATKILKEGRCNSFMIAYQDKRKLKFEEIELKGKELPTIKQEKKPTPSYLG